MKHSFDRPGATFVRTALLLAFLNPLAAAFADGGVTYHDIASDSTAGLDYQRTRSATSATFEAFVDAGVMTVEEVVFTPFKWRGSPGVAILDADGDGDLDLYVPNGPGSPNSLFSSRWSDTGILEFVDVADAAGVTAVDQDSSGVCFGDTDNDGDPDLFVLSNFGPNLFFENRGDGTFADRTAESGLGEETRSSMSCSFGDINGDGLLDVAVANTADLSNQIAIFAEPFALNEHNQLFLNLGGNRFQDVSAESGFLATGGFVPEGLFEGSPTLTWAVAMVDIDLDGDLDIVHADDQGGFPPAIRDGIDRGVIQLFLNDGTGQLTNATAESGLYRRIGAWMGLSFGDLNCDGHLDLFATNSGDYSTSMFSPTNPVYGTFNQFVLNENAPRWMLGGRDGFSDPGVGELAAMPFGWGSVMMDYDNDGDTDIIYHGEFAFGPAASHENPGAILQNDGLAHFRRDADAFATSTNHQRRSVEGVAAGDLNDDGFFDIVTVSSHDVQPSIPLLPIGIEWGSPFDDALYQATFVPTETPGVWAASGLEDNIDGSLAVELSSGGNGNGWVKVSTLGTVGLTSGGVVNRDGIGATVRFGPVNGAWVMQPVLSGSGYASQSSLELGFGLGEARRARIEVRWPGGVRNILYGARAGERIVFPEIPCSFDGPWANRKEYEACVWDSLTELVEGGHLDEENRTRFFRSARRAFKPRR